MIAQPGGVGIVDFDDCGNGHYLLDIATVLSCAHRSAHTQPGGYEDFAHAYLDRGPVNADVAARGPRRIAGSVVNMQAYLEGCSCPGALGMHRP
jgi:thiamine kinase-like enzyme